MINVLKRIVLVILGLLQGYYGSYWFVLGLMGAVPENAPGTKDYEEDWFFVPFGYAMLLIWVGVMITSVVLLKKNKSDLLSFLISWVFGLAGFILWCKLR